MPLSDKDKLAALASVLAHARIQQGSNAARLLSYVVTEDIEGRSQSIKAITIAQDVLARGADFDPSKDSSVRVEMKRLRDILDHYYRTDGAEDPVHISIPKGTYTPQFVDMRTPLPTVEPAAAPRPFPTLGIVVVIGVIMVVAAVWVVNFRANPDQMPNLSGEPTVAVSVLSDSAHDAGVVAQRTLSRFRSFVLASDTEGADFVIELSGRAGLVEAKVIKTQDHSLLAFHTFRDGEIGDIAVPDEPTPFRIWLSRAVALGGIIERDFAERPGVSGDFYCTTLIRDFVDAGTDETHLAIRDCLDAQREAGSTSSRHWGDYSFVYVEEYMSGRNPLPGDALERATTSARAAISADPEHGLGYLRMMDALYASGEYEEGKAEGFRAIALNPFEPVNYLALANRLAKTGEYEEALEMMERHASLTPYVGAGTAMTLFKAHFGLGQLDEAASAARILKGSRANILLAVQAVGCVIQDDMPCARLARDQLERREDDINGLLKRHGFGGTHLDLFENMLESIPR